MCSLSSMIQTAQNEQKRPDMQKDLLAPCCLRHQYPDTILPAAESAMRQLAMSGMVLIWTPQFCVGETPYIGFRLFAIRKQSKHQVQSFSIFQLHSDTDSKNFRRSTTLSNSNANCVEFSKDLVACSMLLATLTWRDTLCWKVGKVWENGAGNLWKTNGEPMDLCFFYFFLWSYFLFPTNLGHGAQCAHQNEELV